MNTLDAWTATVTEALGLEDAVDRDTATKAVLDAARDVAHGVARPAAPLTTFLIGLAAARTPDPVAALPDLVAQVTALAEQWEGGDPQPS